MSRFASTLCLAASLSLTHSATSQVPPADPEAERLPRYHVEVLVFANNEADLTEELFTHRSITRTDLQARPRPVVVNGTQSADAALESSRGGPDNPAMIVLDGFTLEELTWARRAEGSTDPGNLVSAQPEDSADPVGLLPEGPQPVGADASDALVEGSIEEPFIDDLDTSVHVFDGRRMQAFRFRLLDESELQLGDAFERLDRLSAYQPLVHGGWVQEGLPEEQAAPFDLAYLGASNPNGTIKLHLSRFLHLTLNLDYRPTQTSEPSFAVGGPNAFALNELVLQPRYVLNTQRRARSGELHYIDHPLFGVLVLVTPEPEADDSDAAEDLTPAA